MTVGDTLRCVVLQHGEPERAYTIGAALDEVGVAMDVRRIWDGEAVPDSAAETSAVVVMGGSMSAASDDGFPSRRAELALLRDAVARQVPVLGVCLGAQLLAQAGGGRVFAGPTGLELGWTPVHLEAAAGADALFHGLPPRFSALNWHEDTFDLPATAVPLARGDVYRNQAFRIGPRAWGLQFHLEVDGAALDVFLRAFPEEAALADGGAEGLRAAGSVALAELQPVRDLILRRFAAVVAGGDPP